MFFCYLMYVRIKAKAFVPAPPPISISKIRFEATQIGPKQTPSDPIISVDVIEADRYACLDVIVHGRSECEWQNGTDRCKSKGNDFNNVNENAFGFPFPFVAANGFRFEHAMVPSKSKGFACLLDYYSLLCLTGVHPLSCVFSLVFSLHRRLFLSFNIFGRRLLSICFMLTYCRRKSHS